MSEQAEQPIRIQDFERLQMWTPTPGAAGKRAKLSFGIRDGNPRITVFTNDPNDKISSGVIYAAMNPETFYTFLELFGNVVRAKEEIKYKINCFGTRWENDKPTKDKVLISDLCFGRDAEGMIWICVIADNRPKIKFEFNISDYHLLMDGDGKQFDKARASRLEASAKLALLHQVYGIAITKNLENPTPRPNAGARSGFKKPDQSFGKPVNKASADIFEDINF
jgi:hypothetical protein